MPRSRHAETALRDAAVVVPLLLLNLPAVLLTGGYGWDDGAITLAYAQTLAEAGRFAITPASPAAEGASSLAFTILAALPFALGDFGFGAALAIGRLLALIGLVCAALLFRRLIADAVGGVWAVVLTVAVFALPVFQAEIVNGMEMTLFAAAMLGLCLALKTERPALFLGLVPLVLAVRWEAAWYLGAAAAFVLLAEPSRRRPAFRIGCFVSAVFFAFMALRLAIFDSALPNTVLAKTWPPYSPQEIGLVLLKRAAALGEFSDIALPILLAIAGVAALGIGGRVQCPPVESAALGALLAAVLFAALVGRNWGYSGRLYQWTVPLAALLLIYPIARHCGQVGPRARAVGLSAVLGVLVATHLWAMPLQARVVGTVLRGAADDPSWPPQGAAGTLGTVAGEARTGLFRRQAEAARAILRRLGIDNPTYMVGDVGGPALCCPEFRILDIALLTHPGLAREGYGAVAPLIEAERPHLVRTVYPWADYADLYGSAAFSAYVPVVSAGVLFWLRGDLVAALRPFVRRRLRVQDLEALGVSVSPSVRERDWLHRFEILLLE